MALAGALLLLPGGGAPYAAAPAHFVAPRPVGPSASPSAREPERAGSRAGEGRQRPGRTADETDAADDASGVGALPDEPDEAGDGDTEAGDGDPDDDTAASAPPKASAPATPGTPRDDVRQAAAQGERADGPVLQILPLGSGLVLIGLGIALALAALRLRRG
ncbi:hypothetical protein PYK79_05825 [Streptomyces sp. ID05-04B]|uniref:hypothetical protein n=1 Tax=unclassified Streptomyces TaxID=2593676 RepID=UPI000D1C01A0|nr:MULTISPECIES: hypothetical protein [unclassified Streptomyces]AVV41713.1 hypothetical protein C6376_09935 [Streptomyces sp. P3]MDX5563073.1 hypothetical protein [Streptomyces sp. ID05-04B]